MNEQDPRLTVPSAEDAAVYTEAKDWMGGKVVPIEQVIPDNAISISSMVRRMSNTLVKQGQIEPLQVREIGPDRYATFHADPWGSELVHAARQLGWPTLLVVKRKRFEQ